MGHSRIRLVFQVAFLLLSVELLCAADAKTTSLTCVGIYSETSAGYISYRNAGKGDWIVVKIGDVIPSTAEIRINVDRDWIELILAAKPNEVYELVGNEKGEVVAKVADLLKAKPRPVSFPKGTATKPDAVFKDKLVVTQYLGRQIYRTASGESKDIKYGDVLDINGKVKIIAINNTLTLMNASGAVTTVIGPLNFNVEQVLNNKSLYKYLNVQK
jgi:hypothetical protein